MKKTAFNKHTALCSALIGSPGDGLTEWRARFAPIHAIKITNWLYRTIGFQQIFSSFPLIDSFLSQLCIICIFSITTYIRFPWSFCTQTTVVLYSALFGSCVLTEQRVSNTYRGTKLRAFCSRISFQLTFSPNFWRKSIHTCNTCTHIQKQLLLSSTQIYKGETYYQYNIRTVSNVTNLQLTLFFVPNLQGNCLFTSNTDHFEQEHTSTTVSYNLLRHCPKQQVFLLLPSLPSLFLPIFHEQLPCRLCSFANSFTCKYWTKTAFNKHTASWSALIGFPEMGKLSGEQGLLP